MRIHTPISRLCFLLVILLDHASTATALTCNCQGHCSGDRPNGTCETTGSCFSSVQIVWDDELEEHVNEWSSGCVSDEPLQCLRNHGYGISIRCCKTDLCNENMEHPELPIPLNERELALLVFLGTLLLFFFLILLLVCFVCHNESDSKSTVELLDNVVTEGSSSGSGYPVLIERTLAKQLTFAECVGKGRYGEVWRANWRGDNVAVKTFISAEESSWLKELEIYSTKYMRHENILGYIAADIMGNDAGIKMLLVLDYHERGSLYDLLQTTVLDRPGLLGILSSIFSGLVHLHTEIVRHKPAIAHRDIKSKNILVNKRGECVIADFGLSVRYRSDTGEQDVPANIQVGTRRYMAPEVLDGTLNEFSFEAFKMADMYSIALVVWETCRRCASEDGSVESPAIPYHDVVGNDPDHEEMREIVCTRNIRPIVPKRWEEDAVLASLSKIMVECWNSNPSVRLTALRVKKTVMKLREKDCIINIE